MTDLRPRKLRDELAFLLDSTVDLPVTAYDRDTLLMRLEAAFGLRNAVLVEACRAALDTVADAGHPRHISVLEWETAHAGTFSRLRAALADAETRESE